MSFEQSMDKKILIKREDGTEQEANANIQEGGITIQDPTIRITEGDRIYHNNPAGVEEVYEVDRVTYNTSEIMPTNLHHISIRYTKVGSRKHMQHSRPTYNLVNSNLSINSPNSPQGNTVNIDIEELEINDPEIISKLEELQTELKKQNRDESKVRSILKYVADKAPGILVSIATAIFVN